MTGKELCERLSAIGMPADYFAAATGQSLDDLGGWQSAPMWAERVIEGYEMGNVVAKALACVDDQDWSDASTQAAMSILDSYMQRISGQPVDGLGFVACPRHIMRACPHNH
ncbi:MAG TPA: hypothetical protein VE690_09115 [Rhodopila sp.]|jgi:hypothetical protein|nr:hypothetical protein [Rhodopila sp.]